MSIVDSLKKIAIKLGRAATPEEVYAPDITTALKQIAVGYGVAEDPSGVPGSSIDDVINTIAEKITPGGGGNPNSVETITGTLADPFGDHTIEELIAAVGANSATVKMEITLGATSGYVILGSDGTYLFGGFAGFVASGGSGSVETAFRLDYSAEGLMAADAYMSDTYMDLASMAEQVPTEATVIWHPIPE